MTCSYGIVVSATQHKNTAVALRKRDIICTQIGDRTELASRSFNTLRRLRYYTKESLKAPIIQEAMGLLTLKGVGLVKRAFAAAVTK